jgi:mRNA interferase RelE/StbE
VFDGIFDCLGNERKWRDGNMTVSLNNQSARYLARLNEPDYSRLTEALDGLSADPPWGDIKKLQGKESAYRFRLGNYRILFKVKKDGIAVYRIAPRGQAYKE